MTEAIFDFADIKRRMDRKPEPVAAVVPAVPARDEPAVYGAMRQALQAPAGYRYVTWVGRSMDDHPFWRGIRAMSGHTAVSLPPEQLPTSEDVAALRVHLDTTESNQIEDDGWITLWAY